MKVVITGTTNGLGKELARLYSGNMPLAINRNTSKVDPEIICDLSDYQSVRTSAELLLKSVSDSGDVLFILNAAIYGEDETVSDVSPKVLSEVVYTNVFSQLTLVERLLTSGVHVRLAAVSSGMGSISMVPETYHYAYCASKATLNLSVRLMKAQYSGKLDYLLIEPGWMRTRMGGNNAAEDPKDVAINIKTAIEEPMNWNNPNGILDVNTKQIEPW
ncbi:MAG TPA: SDR family NAD(P)-dependent oxidoreductase [Candidatus Saccharimonadales bacterium]